MAVEFAQDCVFPQDLEAAAVALNQELGTNIADTLALIAPIETDVPLLGSYIDQGNLLLAQLLALGDGTSSLHNLDDVSSQFGLPHDPGSQLENETLLHYTGAPMASGVLFVDGSLSPNAKDATNVEVLRRLYFAAGRDLSRVAQLLTLNRSFVTHSKLDIIQLPPSDPNTALSLSQIQTQLNATYLTQDDIAYQNLEATVLLQTYLDTNQPLANTQTQFSLPSMNDIVSSVFHFNQVDNSTTTVNFFSNLGYSGNELAAILAGEDLSTLSSNPVNTAIAASKSMASNIIGILEFVNNRFSTLSTSNLASTQSRVLSKMAALIESHRQTIAISLFEVTVILEIDTLINLRKQLTDAQIIQLLEQRPDIQGIYFNAPDSAYAQTINPSLQVGVGTNNISNAFVNPPSSGTSISQSVLLSMAADLQRAQELLQNFNQSNISSAINELQDFGGQNPFVTVSNPIPIQGQPNTVTPSSILFQYMDPTITFNINARLGAIDDALNTLTQFYTQNIAAPLARIIDIITQYFIQAINAIKQIGARLSALIMPIKNRLDAFMARYLSLTGSGTFNSSLLKCAINFNVGLSTSIFDDLLTLINNLVNAAINIIAGLANLVNQILQKLLCLPINLLNSFLGNLESNLLPSACQLPRVDLGSVLNNALAALRNVATMYNPVFTGLSSDLLRYRAVITNAPDKISQFNANAACSSSNASNFYNASLLNIQGGAIGNPIGAIGSPIGSVGGL